MAVEYYVLGVWRYVDKRILNLRSIQLEGGSTGEGFNISPWFSEGHCGTLDW